MHVSDSDDDGDSAESVSLSNNMTATTFQNSNDTRWDSTKLMIRSYLINYGKYNNNQTLCKLILLFVDVIEQTLRESKIKDKQQLYMDEDELEFLKELDMFLDIFSVSTKSLQAKKSPTIQMIFPFYVDIIDK